MVGRGVALGERAVALAGDLEAVIGDDLRLQLAHHAHELGCAPGFAAHLHAVDGRIVGEVEPQQVELAVVGAQLAHLLVHVVEIAVEVTLLVTAGNGVIAQRGLAVAILREVGVVPVDERVVQANLQTLGAEGLEELGDDVAPEGGFGRFPVGGLRVIQAKAVVVLCGEHGVLHAGLTRGARPGASIEGIRVELIEIRSIQFLGHFLVAANPFSASGDRVQTEMKEKTEAIVQVPFHSFVIPNAIKLISHGISVLLPSFCVQTTGCGPRKVVIWA